MDTEQKRIYLIKYMLAERNASSVIPQDEYSQRRLLRALFNTRLPMPVGEEFLRVQDDYLQARRETAGVTDISELTPVSGAPDLYLWRGDITTLKCDGIVNAANSELLGCFHPNHGCIDNAVHTFAGVQLRAECDAIMRAQGHSEPTGGAKLTRGYNLPCKYVLHTVGPIVYGALRREHEEQLESCYRSCFELAYKNGLESLAYCCISTGEFMFPAERAAKIAIDTVLDCKRRLNSGMKIIFNVFKESDREIYSKLLGAIVGA